MLMEPITLADLEKIVELEKQLYIKPWSIDNYRQELNENKFAYYFKLTEKDELIGYMGFWILFDKAEITKVSINPKYQGHHISYILMDDIEMRVKAANCSNITLEVRKSNVIAKHVYEKCGFKVVANRSKYYDNGEDAYLMLKELV